MWAISEAARPGGEIISAQVRILPPTQKTFFEDHGKMLGSIPAMSFIE